MRNVPLIVAAALLAGGAGCSEEEAPTAAPPAATVPAAESVTTTTDAPDVDRAKLDATLASAGVRLDGLILQIAKLERALQLRGQSTVDEFADEMADARKKAERASADMVELQRADADVWRGFSVRLNQSIDSLEESVKSIRTAFDGVAP